VAMAKMATQSFAEFNMGTKHKSGDARVARTGVGKAQQSTLHGMTIESVQNTQRALPADVAALFDDLLSRSVQISRAEQQLMIKMAEASAKFKQEQTRLEDTLTQRLGLSAIGKDLALMRERRDKAVTDAMQSAHSVVARQQSDAGTAARKGKSRGPDISKGRA